MNESTGLISSLGSVGYVLRLAQTDRVGEVQYWKKEAEEWEDKLKKNEEHLKKLESEKKKEREQYEGS